MIFTCGLKYKKIGAIKMRTLLIKTLNLFIYTNDY